MKVTVTGSSGLLGSHVAAALVEANHEVLGVDRVPPPGGAAVWTHVSADLSDLGAALQLIRDCAAIVHVAAIPRPTGLPPVHVFGANVHSTYNVVEAAVLNGVSRFVYASSMSVLGYPFFETPIAPIYLPIDSRHPVGPQDAYAVSKWLGEEIVESAVRRRPGLGAVSLRMPWIQTAESFPREVSARRARAMLVARDLWGYLDARDAAAAFVAAVERPIQGHTRLYISAADTFMEVETEALVQAAYPDAERKRPLVGHETVFDLSEAAEQLGFLPRHGWRDYRGDPQR